MPAPVEMIGLKFNRLTVTKQVASIVYPSTVMRAYEAVCDCGKTVIVQGADLRSGNTKSCGCWRVENTRRIKTTHGDARVGKITPEWRAWCNLIRRCEDPSVDRYPAYGGRGIKVCKRWKKSYPNFLSDMGRKPGPTHSIDRIDVNGDYKPSNCRWATPEEQKVNKRPDYRTRRLLDNKPSSRGV